MGQEMLDLSSDELPDNIKNFSDEHKFKYKS